MKIGDTKMIGGKLRRLVAAKPYEYGGDLCDGCLAQTSTEPCPFELVSGCEPDENEDGVDAIWVNAEENAEPACTDEKRGQR